MHRYGIHVATNAYKVNNHLKVENIGTTPEGRSILVLKICANRKCGSRPIIWIDSGIHAREWIGPAVVSYLARVRKIGCGFIQGIVIFSFQELVEKNSKNSQVTSLFDWYLLSVANPDGYVETFTGDRYDGGDFYRGQV